MASGREGKMILALHGFLGLPSDWDSVLGNRNFHAIDLWNDIATIDEDSGDAFSEWTARFIRFVEKLTAERIDSAVGGDPRPLLLGYSMGGRLAMQALIARPDLFRGSVIVSAHPGLTSEAKRVARAESDERWAQRFLKESWDALMLAWNEQGVLARPPTARNASVRDEFDRQEREFDRKLLARALRVWSLARQRDLRPDLEKLDVPTLFLSGAEDFKFTALLSRISLNSFQRRQVLPGAGHRLPWDDPAAFRASFDRFSADPASV